MFWSTPLRRSCVLALALAFATGACAPTQKTALKGNADPAQVNRALDPVIQQLKAVNQVDGSIRPWSDFDFTDERFKDGFPFKEAESDEENPNHPLRALLQIPPAQAIRSVTRMTLVFKEIDFHSDAKEKAELFKDQVLCLMDSMVCLGAKPSDAGAASRVNDSFWKGAKTVPGGLIDSAVYSEQTRTWEIDLLKAFQIEGSESLKFLLASSAAYSEEGAGFRKLRFMLGDRISAREGQLEISYDLDPALVPGDYAKRKPIPIHGAADDAFANKRKRVKSPKLDTDQDWTEGLERDQGLFKLTSFDQKNLEEVLSKKLLEQASRKIKDSKMDGLKIIARIPDEKSGQSVKEALGTGGLSEDAVGLLVDSASHEIDIRLSGPDSKEIQDLVEEIRKDFEPLNRD